MKKQLFSLRDETTEALNKYKADGGGDKSPFVDGLISKALGVPLPEEPAQPSPEPAPAEPVTAAEVLSPEPSTAIEEVIAQKETEPEFPTPEEVDAPPANEMPIVEPLQPAQVPEQPEQTAKAGVRICPNGHGEYDTPFCLDCI